MVWWFIIVICVLILLLCWLALSPFELQVDTRTPQAFVKWFSIGQALVIFENETWWLKIRILFFSKRWEMEKLVFGRKKKTKRPKPAKEKRKRRISLQKFLRLVRTFRILQWQIAIDSGDVTKNAWLYALNFYPATRHHVFINYTDENYVLLKIRNTPWKLIVAFMR